MMRELKSETYRGLTIYFRKYGQTVVAFDENSEVPASEGLGKQEAFKKLKLSIDKYMRR